MEFYFSNKSLENLKGVDSTLQELLHNSLALSPIDFGIPNYGGLRTEEEQNTLFRKGLSKCDGHKNKSRHQSGKAFDIYGYVDGKASWEKHHLSMIAGVIMSEAKRMKINLKWGGTFGSNAFDGWDMPHFEMV